MSGISAAVSQIPIRRLIIPAQAILMIVLVAVLAMGPELAVGLTITDNYRLNLTWPQQFVELFRDRNLYPRWLPHSWGGMGSPAFYFYPPLFFWVASIVDVLTAGAFGSERLVPLASLVLLIASGLSMRAWLRAHGGERPAIAGAIAYMVGPFHLYHLYGTGALAEASAYASVPLVMLALARLGEGRTRFLPVLAISYALLLFSHLPAALLVSLFLIGPYVAFTAAGTARPARFLTMALAGGLLGIALAAVFVVPALALLNRVSPSALSGSFYRPENWFFWHVRAGIMTGRMLLIIPISIAALLFAAGTMLAARRNSSRKEPMFWAVLTMFLVMLIAGAIPIVWELPGLMLVQFPWRALLLCEFTTVTLIVVGAPSVRNPFILAGIAALAFAYVALGMMTAHTVGRTWRAQQLAAAEIRASYSDAPEYLPAGSRIHMGVGPDDIRVFLPNLPLATATSPQARLSVSEAPDGGITVVVISPTPTRVNLRRFYFPHWRLHDGSGRLVPIIADPHDKVVSFLAPAGRSSFQLAVGTAPYEMLGRIVSLIALIALGGIALRVRRQPKSSAPTPANPLGAWARA